MTVVHVQHERACLRQRFDERYPAAFACVLEQPLQYSAAVLRINQRHSQHLLVYPVLLITLTLAALGPVVVGACVHEGSQADGVGVGLGIGIAMLAGGLCLSALLVVAVIKLQRRLLVRAVADENALLTGAEHCSDMPRWRVVLDGAMLGDDGRVCSGASAEWLADVRQWDDVSGVQRMKIRDDPRQFEGYHLILDLGAAWPPLSYATVEAEPGLPPPRMLPSLDGDCGCATCRNDAVLRSARLGSPGSLRVLPLHPIVLRPIAAASPPPSPPPLLPPRAAAQAAAV